MIAVALLSMLLGGLVLALRPECRRLTVVNRSGQSISRLIVTVSGEPLLITDLADGSTAIVPFPLHDDVRFNLAGTFGNRTLLRSSFIIKGNPKRFARLACAIGQEGKLRLSLGR
jgi:hypothetical protein